MIKQLELHSKQFEVWEDKHRFKVICAGRRWGKALYIKTPILTENGFKPLIDIKIGDFIFNEKGKLCKVISKSEVFFDRQCFKIIFSDGSSIIADAEHEWVVQQREYRKNFSRNKSTITKPLKLTTKEISQSFIFHRPDGRKEHNYAVPLVVVDFPEKNLPLEPYFLGLWLGDGNSFSCAITTADPEVIDYLKEYAKKLGKKISIAKNTKSLALSVSIRGDRSQKSRNESIQAILRSLKLLGNKHIPKEYLFSSYKQRLELIRGIMDSDGYCENGYYEFSSKSEQLAKDVKLLLTTLGIKTTIHKEKSFLYKKFCGYRYRLHFSTNLDLFNLKRKKITQKRKRKLDIYKRFIVGVEEIPSVPVQCLTIDNPSGLFLAGEDLIITHNSTLAIVSALSHCQKNNSITAIVAPTYQQAKDIYWRDPEKISSLIPPEAILKKNDSELFIQFVNGSYLYLRGSDRPETLRGLRYDFVVLDEYASMKANVWEEIVQPTLIDSGGSALFISCVTGNTLVLGEDGFSEIGDIEKTTKPHFKKYFSRLGMEKSSDFFISPPSKTIKIITKRGYEIEGTTHHPILTFSSHGFIWKKLEEIKKGDVVVIMKGMNIWGNNDKIIFKKVRRKSRVNFKMPDIVTFPFAYFIGLIISEGYVEKSGRIIITCGDKEVFNFLKEKLPDFNFCSSLKRTNQLVSCRADFVDWLYQNGYVSGAKNKVIPKCVFKWSKENVVWFLRGMFDGDGSNHKNRRFVSYVTTSKKLADQLQVLLLNFGIISTKYSYISPPTEKVRVYSRHYTVEIYGENYDIFMKEIGFNIKRKNFYISRTNTKRNSDKNYIPFISKKMRKIYCQLPRKKREEKWTLVFRNNSVTLKSLREFLEKTKTKDNELEEIARGLYYFDYVKEIEFSKYKKKTYDFVMPQSHSFFSNGFISHNTPKGYDKFYNLWLKGQGEDPNWKSWRFTSFDNPYLDKQFIEQCRKDMDEDTFGQEILAEFKKFTGLVYKDFKREKHVIEPIELKSNWSYYRAIDFGFVNPTAVLFVAISEVGKIYVYDEIYLRGLQTPDLANLINQKSIGRTFVNTIADSEQASDIAELQRYGLSIYPVKKTSGDWTTFRIRKVSEKLRNGQLLVFKNCKNLIFEFENYRYHEVRDGQQVKEVPMKMNDHCLDALSYLIVSLPERIEPIMEVSFERQLEELPKEEILKNGFY